MKNIYPFLQKSSIHLPWIRKSYLPYRLFLQNAWIAVEEVLPKSLYVIYRIALCSSIKTCAEESLGKRGRMSMETKTPQVSYPRCQVCRAQVKLDKIPHSLVFLRKGKILDEYLVCLECFNKNVIRVREETLDESYRPEEHLVFNPKTGVFTKKEQIPLKRGKYSTKKG